MSEDFVKVANTNDIQPSHMKEVLLDGDYYLCRHPFVILNDTTLYYSSIKWIKIIKSIDFKGKARTTENLTS